MSGLARAIREITAPEPTMGAAAVAALMRPGEIRLEGRDERVLVAGNAMPEVGSMTPWVMVSAGLLVAVCNVPQMAPAPLVVPEVRIPIFLGVELLYGDELDTGYHCYAASWDPAEGGVEVDPHVAWVRTRNASVPGSVSSPECVLGGGFEYNFFYDHFLRMTFYEPVGGGETTVGPQIPVYGGLYGLHDGDMFSIHLRLPPSGLPRNGGVRIYHAWHDAREPGELGPFHLCFEFPGSLEPGYDIYEHLDVVIEAPNPEGAEPPDENTLALRRVGVTVGVSEDDADEVAALNHVLLYRSLVQAQTIDPPPGIGYIGEAAMPLMPVQTKFHFIDDTGPGIGDPPALPWGEE